MNSFRENVDVPEELKQQEEGLINKGWQVIKLGVNKNGYLLPSMGQVFQSLQEAIIYQMARDAFDVSNAHSNKYTNISSNQDVEPDIEEPDTKGKANALETSFAFKNSRAKRVTVDINVGQDTQRSVKSTPVRTPVKRKSTVEALKDEDSASSKEEKPKKQNKKPRSAKKRTFIKKSPKRVTKKPTELSTPTSFFNKVWPRLKNEYNWKHFNGDLSNDFFYALPNVNKKRDGVLGVDMFTASEAYLYLINNLPDLLEEQGLPLEVADRNAMKRRRMKTRTINTEPNRRSARKRVNSTEAPKENVETPLSKGQKKHSKTEKKSKTGKKVASSRRAETMNKNKRGTTKVGSYNMLFQQIWPDLKQLGWKYFTGNALADYFFALPEVQKKSEGVFGENIFTAAAAYEYLLKNEPKLLERLKLSPSKRYTSGVEDDESLVAESVASIKSLDESGAESVTVSKNEAVLNRNLNAHFDELEEQKKQDKKEPLLLTVKNPATFFAKYIWPTLQGEWCWKYLKNTKFKLEGMYFIAVEEATIDDVDNINQPDGRVFKSGEQAINYFESLEDSDENLNELQLDLLHLFRTSKQKCYDDGKLELVDMTAKISDLRARRATVNYSPTSCRRRRQRDSDVNSIDDFGENISSRIEPLTVPKDFMEDVEKIIAEEGQIISFSDLTPSFTKDIAEAFEERQKLEAIPIKLLEQIGETVNKFLLFREAEVKDILIKLSSKQLQGLHLMISSNPGQGKSILLEKMSKALRTHLSHSARYHVIHQVASKDLYNVVFESLGRILAPDYLSEDENDYEKERLRRIKDNKSAFQDFMAGCNAEEAKLKQISDLVKTNETRINIFYFLDASLETSDNQIAVLQEMLLDYDIDLRIVQSKPLKSMYFASNVSNTAAKMRLRKYSSKETTEIIRYVLSTRKRITLDRVLISSTTEELQNYTTNLNTLLRFFLSFGTNDADHDSLITCFKTQFFEQQEKSVMAHLSNKEIMLIFASYLCSVNTRPENVASDRKSMGLDLQQRAQSVKAFSYHELLTQFNALLEHLTEIDFTISLNKLEIDRLIDQGFVAVAGTKYHTLVDKDLVLALLQKIKYPVRLEDLVRN